MDCKLCKLKKVCKFFNFLEYFEPDIKVTINECSFYDQYLPIIENNTSKPIRLNNVEKKYMIDIASKNNKVKNESDVKLKNEKIIQEKTIEKVTKCSNCGSDVKPSEILICSSCGKECCDNCATVDMFDKKTYCPECWDNH